MIRPGGVDPWRGRLRSCCAPSVGKIKARTIVDRYIDRTLIPPQLTAFLLKWSAKYSVLIESRDYTTLGILRTGGFLILFFLIAAAIGLLWKPKLCSRISLSSTAFYRLLHDLFTNGFASSPVSSVVGILARSAKRPAWYATLVLLWIDPGASL